MELWDVAQVSIAAGWPNGEPYASHAKIMYEAQERHGLRADHVFARAMGTSGEMQPTPFHWSRIGMMFTEGAPRPLDEIRALIEPETNAIN